MSKLLSRSKHEEFESNSALQIRDQKERRVENARKKEHNKVLAQLRNCLCLTLFIHHALLTSCAFLLFDTFCYKFLFLPILSPVIAFGFRFCFL